LAQATGAPSDILQYGVASAVIVVVILFLKFLKDEREDRKDERCDRSRERESFVATINDVSERFTQSTQAVSEGLHEVCKRLEHCPNRRNGTGKE